jgi:uncharacterized protein
MKIKLDLKQIFEKEKQPFFRAEYEINPEDLEIPADVGEITEPIKVDVYIVKNPKGEGYKVMYNIKGNIDLTCSRCLETFKKDLSGEHNVVLVNNYGEREHLRDSELNEVLIENNILNLTDLIREQILLDIPYKPLCHPECKGVEVLTSAGTEEKKNPFGVLKNLLNQG